ncbi:Iron uptake protein A1 precursor [Roseovarius litorisediminis]|uniref:Iron uptake protein A1 n=1 Tax=Roseovarius litorisediminis TaxID=1312363 RepID=A0A1Y5SH38_9RHOB|nr:extracellular solute-binding protein [Roseovarius litorisediminis]SLN40349.1 Iron uptake protein A1 precursor [Roseovarius litorisediminis]
MSSLKFAQGLTISTALAAFAAPAFAQEVNIYSSRHYDADDALYARFTEETGISVNRIEGKADELIARLTAEGDNSPADIFIAVDVGRMDRAEKAGVLQPFNSDVIEARIPDHLQHPDNLWFGVSQRARMIFYAKDRVDSPPATYEDLAMPEWKDKVCIRSSSNVYNQSLLASIIEVDGEEAAMEWAQGIVNNMARPPQGGDTDQLRGLVSGECDIAVANHYYFLRGFDQDVDGLSAGIDSIGWVWPNQDGRGAHINLATASITAAAPHPEEATALLEFLTSDFAQQHFANQNHEYPAVPGLGADDSTARLGDFKADTTTNTSAFSRNAGKAQIIFNQVGWN